MMPGCMNDTNKTHEKRLHTLIDELTVYINMLNNALDDAYIIDVFGKRLFRCGKLLYSCGFDELSELALHIHSTYVQAYNRSIFSKHEILKIALAFLGLARHALMFYDKPDFSEASHAMMFELSQSLQKFNERISTL